MIKGGKNYRNKGILDDMEEDLEIDGYNEYKVAEDHPQRNNDLTAELAEVKKNQSGYRDRLYSSSGIIVEGAEKNSASLKKKKENQ